MTFGLGAASTDPNIAGRQALFLSKVPELSDGGASGYAWLFKDFENPDPATGPLNLGGVSGHLALQDTHDEEAMLALMNPIAEEAAEHFPASNITFGLVFEKYDSFLDWFDVHCDQSAAGMDLWIGSRLFDGEALGDSDKLAGDLDRMGDGAELADVLPGRRGGRAGGGAEGRGECGASGVEAGVHAQR